MPQRRVRVVPTYTQEARGTYGVAFPIINGVEAPQFMETKDYTRRKMILVKRWNSEGKQEFSYVNIEVGMVTILKIHIKRDMATIGSRSFVSRLE